MLTKESTLSREKVNTSVRSLVTQALLVALCYIVMRISKILPSVYGFLEFDLKDTVLVLAGFLYGPMAALQMTLVVCFLQFVTISTTGLPGFAMNIIATGSFSCVASLIYWYYPKFKGAVVGLTLGGLVMTTMMLLWNYAITPMYMGLPRSDVAAMLVPIFLPFNLVKSGLNAGVILTLYPRVMDALCKANLVANPEDDRGEYKMKAFLISFGILVAFVLIALGLMGIL